MIQTKVSSKGHQNLTLLVATYTKIHRCLLPQYSAARIDEFFFCFFDVGLLRNISIAVDALRDRAAGPGPPGDVRWLIESNRILISFNVMN